MRFRLLPILLLIVGLTGWNSAQAASKAAASKIANQHLSDPQIESLIRAKLAKSKVAPEGFTVHVHNKVATFEGKTGVIQHKGVATRMAKTAGAVSVVNNIKISEEARQKAAAKLAKNRNGGGEIQRAALVK